MAKVTDELKVSVTGVKSVALSTLASRVLLLLDGNTFVSGGTLITQTQIHTITLPDANDGPFLVGVATGALTAAEIEAYLENEGPSGPTHSSQTEIATRGRHIRITGVLKAPAENETNTYVMWREKQVMKLGFTEQDAGYAFWIYNLGATLVAGSTWNVQEESFVIFDKD